MIWQLLQLLQLIVSLMPDGKVLGIQLYNGDKETVCDISVVESAVHEFKTQPNAYSLDFGVTEDGRTLLIEMNDGLAIG